MSRLNTFRYYVVGAVLLFCVAFLVGSHLPILEKKHRDYGKEQLATVILRDAEGTGSGAVVRRTNSQGNTRLFIWTAAHVVSASDEVVVETKVRNEYRKVGTVSFKARVIMRAPAEDIALLWLDAPEGFFNYVQTLGSATSVRRFSMSGIFSGRWTTQCRGVAFRNRGLTAVTSGDQSIRPTW
jgi:S1-C subfamily serine protease